MTKRRKVLVPREDLKEWAEAFVLLADNEPDGIRKMLVKSYAEDIKKLLK